MSGIDFGNASGVNPVDLAEVLRSVSGVSLGSATPAPPPTRQVVEPVGPAPFSSKTVIPNSGNVVKQIDNLLDFANGLSNSGGGSTSSSSTTTSNSSRTVTIQDVLNEAARAAAFNSQRDAQAGAFRNQAVRLEESLVELVARLGGLRQGVIDGINEQEQLATDNVDRQVDEGNESINAELATVLASLASAQTAVESEADRTQSALSSNADDSRARALASNERLAALGGGDELAAATAEALGRTESFQQINSTLSERLAQASEGDFQRRIAGSEATSAAARRTLDSDAALLLAQIVAGASQQRNSTNQEFAAREFELNQSVEAQILDALLQGDLAAAQRFIPEPVRRTVTNTSSSSTSNTSSRSSGRGGIGAGDQFRIESALNQAGNLLNPQTVSAQEQLAEVEAQIRLDAIRSQFTGPR